MQIVTWLLLKWIEKLYVENIIIENVKEFTNWGPLTAKGQPDKRYKGQYFKKFIDTLKIMYNVEYRVLNAADFGDATARQRLFIIARRPKHRPIKFPEPTHASRERLEKKQPSLHSNQKFKTWRPSRDIIDWELEGKSIFGRKKPLSKNTMRRIYTGLFKFGLKDFLANQSELEPYLVNMKGKSNARDINEPTFTQTAGRFHQYLVEPFVVNISHTQSKDEGMCKSLDHPLNTILTKAHLGLIEPFISSYHGGKDSDQRNYPVDRPLPTLDTSNRFAIIRPYLVKFYGSSDASSLNEPLGTITTKDRFGLCIPQIGAVLDIKFRMLQPHELAAAMSFPKTYSFSGTKADKVKQIGNAVPVNLAKALCTSVLFDQ